MLVTPNGWSPAKILGTRLLLVFLLFCFVFTLLWADRDGLRDHADGELSFADVVYFTMITVTTVGYGDIVPVSTVHGWWMGWSSRRFVSASGSCFWGQPIS
ncbi:MAG: two pore domain potassium channel family protein [Nitrospira sp.]|nr:two pore domain potassium channel family protein [Nitrospira sp.]